MKEDEKFMGKALLLARKAEGRTRPNPLVGALVVKNSRIVGKGFHKKAGESHGEIEALAIARNKARGATLYTTMEPCTHWGRTGPCTEAIIAHGIRRVVIGSIDPNPLVSGKGVRALRRASVEVTLNVLADEARRINEAYFSFMRTGRPFVIMKAAVSMDGRIATGSGESQWISGEEARAFAHRLRQRADAVMVGIGTILKDDPLLTVRYGMGNDIMPYRVIVDSSLRIPDSARVLRHEPWMTVIATTRRAPEKKKERLLSIGVEVLTLPSSRGTVNLRALLNELGKRGIQGLLVEGGARIFASLMKDRLVNKAFIILAPMLLGEGVPLFRGWGVKRLKDGPVLKRVRVMRLGRDLVVEGYLSEN